MGQKKVALVVHHSLDAGRKSNCAAILMGQLALLDGGMYRQVFADPNGTLHAAICDNVVVLETGGAKLQALPEAAQGLICVVFTDHGQALSYSFEQYREDIAAGTAGANIIGVGLYGEADAVSAVTKKFSLVK